MLRFSCLLGLGLSFVLIFALSNTVLARQANSQLQLPILDRTTSTFAVPKQSEPKPSGGKTDLTRTVEIADTLGGATPPVITYTPIPANSVNPTLATTITDAVGVTGATIFWSINGGSYSSASCVFAAGTPLSGTWNCMISGTAFPNAISYYVTANDAALNTSTNPAAGAGGPNLYSLGAATIPAGTYTNVNFGDLVTLGGNVFVNSNMTLNGIVSTGVNTINLECAAQVVGGGEFSYVIGALGKAFCGAGTFTFNIGAPAAAAAVLTSSQDDFKTPEGVVVSNYSPLTVTITGGTVGSSLKVGVFDSFLAGFDPARSISRNWSVEESGNLTASLAFTYRNEDVNGNEADYRVYRYPGTGPITNVCPGAPCVNAATNTVTTPQVSDFSRWTAAELLVPTAAPVSVSGRVFDSNGRPIRNAILTLSGGNLSEPLQIATGPFGYYWFSGLTIGSYAVTVTAQRYTFATPQRSVSVHDDVADFDFIAEPRQ